MADEVKVVTPKDNGVRSTISISNTDLVTTMVVKLMKKLKSDLALAHEKRIGLEKELYDAPTKKAIDLAKETVEKDENLVAWKSLLKKLNPKTDFEINLREDDISRYVSRAIDSLRVNEGEVKFEVVSLSFNFDDKNDRRSAPYFYNVKIGDLRNNEFPVDISFKMNINKTELNNVLKEISQIEDKIRNKQAIQDEATAKITEASLANNPELAFLANIDIEPSNLLAY